MRRIEYKDTEKKLEVEIYGLKFEINSKEFENIDTRNISENENLEGIIDKVLGEGACNKINEQRVKDGYETMNGQIALTIMAFLTDTYVESTVQPVNNTIDKYERYNKRFKNYGRRNRYRR